MFHPSLDSDGDGCLGQTRGDDVLTVVAGFEDDGSVERDPSLKGKRLGDKNGGAVGAKLGFYCTAERTSQL